MTWAEDIEDVLRYSTRETVSDVRGLLRGGALFLVMGAGLLVAVAAAALDLHPAFLLMGSVVWLVCLLAVTGYLVRVTRNAALGRGPDVAFTWGVLLDGVFYWLALLPWLAFAGFVAVAPAVAALSLGGWLGLATAFLIVSGVVLAWVYVYPAVTLVYCTEGWRPAYGIGVWRLSTSRTYVAVSLVYHAVASVAVLALSVSLFTVVGWAWLSFLFLAWSAAFWGRSYRRIES